jgi:AcrR family transcriptional regulator
MARRGHHTLEEIKSMVLAAAEDLVVQGGLPLLTARRIATKIDYTVGSIYMVFEGMNDLIMHLKGRFLDDMAEEMDRVQRATSKQCLEELADVYIRYASQHFNRWCMVFEHRLPEDTQAPDWYKNKLDSLYRQFEDQFGQLSPELPLVQRKQTALAFLGGLHGICVFKLTTPLGGKGDNDIKESVLLLINKFAHDARTDSMNGVQLPKNEKEAKGQLSVVYPA